MNLEEILNKKVTIVLIILIALSPLFAYAAEAVNYSEPLENTAEEVGAEEHPVYSGILPDYTVPGIDPYVGTLISALLGTFITMLFAIGIAKIVAQGKKDGNSEQNS